MLEGIPDYEARRKRYAAWWRCEVLDRALTHIACPNPSAPRATVSRHATLRDRWLDIDFAVARARHRCESTLFLGDALPIVWPNLGPSAFSAFFGCELEFERTTSWVRPCLTSWEDADALRLDPDNVYYRKYHELTDAFIEAGRGKWITGLWDFHPGGDHAAAVRGTETLAVDLLTHPEEVKRFLARMEGEYFRVYDEFYEKIRAAGLPATSWLSLIADGRYYIPSNDFSCVVSREMFDEFFLPGIRRECQFLDYSIYHLDGPGALRHLDSLLEIPELGAVQWVPGAGAAGFHKWVDVYRKVQAAGKGIDVACHLGELDLVMETLRPEGAFLHVRGVPSPEAAEAALKKIARWR